MICLVRGNRANNFHADKTLTALATNAVNNFNRRTLVLQFTSEMPVEHVLLGRMINSSTLKAEESSFDDTGMDALFRRVEIGTVSNEQFSDCCLNVIKERNSYDIAYVSKKADYIKYLLNNEEYIRELLKSARIVYECIYLLVDSKEEELVNMLLDMVDRDIICVPQGKKVDVAITEKSVIAVNNYNPLSCFNTKAMAKDYGVKTVYPVPYNITFIDACNNQFTLEFLISNVSPEADDEAYYFKDCITKINAMLLGMDEPEIKEHNFVFTKNNRRR